MKRRLHSFFVSSMICENLIILKDLVAFSSECLGDYGHVKVTE